MKVSIFSPMSKAYDLIVVAHPDDETIFFGGLALQCTRRRPLTIVCATDGNADGHGVKRRKQFRQAASLLGAREVLFLGCPDIYRKRLDLKLVANSLKALKEPHRIFTHGILGEYGHPHHQDVSFAVHEVFQNHKHLYSVAYNCFSELSIRLERKDYERKCQILSKIYHSETKRFSQFLPATFTEGFTRVSFSEVQALYDFFTLKTTPRARDLDIYRWYWTSYLKGTIGKIQKRPF